MLGQMLERSAVVVGTGILVAMLMCHFMHADDSTKVAGCISGIVIVAHGTNPWSYALLRLTETTLGILVAWVISFVPILIRIEKEETESKADRPEVSGQSKEDRRCSDLQ